MSGRERDCSRSKNEGRERVSGCLHVYVDQREKGTCINYPVHVRKILKTDQQ